MRALTVQQPWAWAIVHGGKDVENRTQAWSYRGPLAIHAGLQVDQDGVDHELLRPEWAVGRGYVHRTPGAAQLSYKADAERETPARLAAVMPLGMVVGVVDLVDVHVSSRSAAAMPCPCCLSPWAQYSAGPTRPVVHLVVESPRPFAEPIPAKGWLGLWTPEVELLDRIREQVPA